jgi:creatinine amidohydrolase/Fe(II)-dependent formamide hydrolase-like protein
MRLRQAPRQPKRPASAGRRPDTYFWGELCWPDAAHRLDIVDTALLPVGAIEQHGPHLPLDTDAFDAEYLAKCVADGCSDPQPLVLPLIAYGVSYHHEAFKGTISINNDTLANLVYDIGISVAKNGIKKLVIINGHGGNAPSLNFAAQRINQDARIFVCVDTGETSDVDVDSLIETPNDVHAGEIETSTSLAIRPHLVRMDRLQRRCRRLPAGIWTLLPNGVSPGMPIPTKYRPAASWVIRPKPALKRVRRCGSS